MKPKNKHKFSISDYPFVVIYDSTDEVYVARSLDLKGCHSEGSTPEEAVKRMEEAIQGWLETAQKNNISIPRPSTFKSKKLTVQLDPENLFKLEALATSYGKSVNHLVNQAIAAL